MAALRTAVDTGSKTQAKLQSQGDKAKSQLAAVRTELAALRREVGRVVDEAAKEEENGDSVGRGGTLIESGNHGEPV